MIYIAAVQRAREIAETVVCRGIRELARVLRGERRRVIRAGNGDGDRLRDKTAMVVVDRGAVGQR